MNVSWWVAEEPWAWAVHEDRRLILLGLYVPQPLRGQGHGTACLHAISQWCLARGVRRIDLDDMSDRHRQPRINIYCKSGFRYRHTHGPEMYASPRSVAAFTAACHPHIRIHVKESRSL